MVERTARALVTVLLLPLVIGVAALIAAHAMVHGRRSLSANSARLRPDRWTEIRES
jgi:hypothetical protein